jgi:hypothetical protein
MLQSAFTYLRTNPDTQRHQQTSNGALPLCDVIEDFRASTFFDALGSIGGLFALLQSIHVMLLGRPLLWGITGT